MAILRKTVCVQNTHVSREYTVWFVDEYDVEKSDVLSPGETGTFLMTPEQITALDSMDVSAPATGLVILYQSADLESALAGDLVFKITPITRGSSAAAVNAAITVTEKYDVTVDITLENAAGERHTWFTGSVTLGIADNASGTAALPKGTTQTLVNGKLTTVVRYTGTWALGNTATLTLSAKTILGTTVTGGTSVDTFVA